MRENSRIRFNPVTKEIEIEGSESFVKIYFKKLQVMVFGLTEKTVAAKKEPKPVKGSPVKTDKKELKVVNDPAASCRVAKPKGYSPAASCGGISSKTFFAPAKVELYIFSRVGFSAPKKFA